MDTTPQEEYHQVARVTRPERQGVSRRSVIEEAKAKVPTIDLADLLCGPGKMRKVGERWVARCPLPDHKDRSPSFTVYLETNSFFCYGCLRGGDVVDLARFAWSYEMAEVATAAAYLLLEFGHPIPERSVSWFAKQKRQMPVRDGIDAAKVSVARRRLYRRFFEPLVLATEDEDDRAHDAQLFWASTLPLAEHLVSTMMGSAVTNYRDPLPDDLRGAPRSPASTPPSCIGTRNGKEPPDRVTTKMRARSRMLAPTPIGHEGCLLADVRWLQRSQRTSETKEGGYRDLIGDIVTDSSQAEGESQDKDGKKGVAVFITTDYVALPPGLYVGELFDIEPRESENGEYRRWCWNILEGPYAGRRVYANTSTNFGPQAKARQWVENILDRELEAGKQIGVEDLVGGKHHLMIENVKRDGRTFDNVSAVHRYRE